MPMRTQNADTAINVTCDAPASESLPNARIVATSIITSNAIGVNDSNADGRFFKCAVAACFAFAAFAAFPAFTDFSAFTHSQLIPFLLFSIVFILKYYVYLYIIIYYYDMQSYCIFCIYTTFHTAKRIYLQ